MPRHRYGSLKPLKRQIAAGDLDGAYQALLGKHAALMMTLKTASLSDDQTSLVKYRLTLVEIQLAVADSLKNKHADADRWFRKARKHLMVFDPVTEERLNREEASHLIRKGQVHDALDLLSGTELRFREIMRFRRSSLPIERLELEHAATLSAQAGARLQLDPMNVEARDDLRDAQCVLRVGNKRDYELDNLMLLVAYTGLFDPQRPRNIARAALINETVVRNPAHRLALLDAACGPLPIKSFIQRLR